MADLRERGIVTKVRSLKTGRTIGGIPFTRGPLAHLLRNRFYIGEVMFKGEVFPGEQPCPCSKTYPWGNGSPLKNVAEDFAMEHLALSGPERLARVLGAIASSGLVADRSELSGRNGRACVVTMGA
jgi:hypothetical protein